MAGFNEDKVLADGNTAAALGSIFGGGQLRGVVSHHPGLQRGRQMNKYLPKLRTDPETGLANFAVIQAEDELAAARHVGRRRVGRRTP